MSIKNHYFKIRSYLAHWLVCAAFRVHHNAAKSQCRRVIGAIEFKEISDSANRRARWRLGLGSISMEKIALQKAEKQVAGAIISAIDAHGPITKNFVGSAAKRVVGTLIK